MERPTFRCRTFAAWQLGPGAAAVPGAFEAVFGEQRKLVTLLTDDARIVQAFGFAGCGLVAGAEVDISARGCAKWKPVAHRGEDHDLLALGPQGLHFGVRPRDNDMCTPDRRPSTLLAPVVQR